METVYGEKNAFDVYLINMQLSQRVALYVMHPVSRQPRLELGLIKFSTSRLYIRIFYDFPSE